MSTVGSRLKAGRQKPTDVLAPEPKEVNKGIVGIELRIVDGEREAGEGWGQKGRGKANKSLSCVFCLFSIQHLSSDSLLIKRGSILVHGSKQREYKTRQLYLVGVWRVS